HLHPVGLPAAVATTMSPRPRDQDKTKPGNGGATPEWPASPPPPKSDTPKVDAAVLRRAHRHGKRSRPHYPGKTFEEVEADLRAGWLLGREKAKWQDVREAVRRGFEQGAT